MAFETSSMGYIGESRVIRKEEVFGQNVLNIGAVFTTKAKVTAEEGDKSRHVTRISLKSGVTIAPTGAAALGLGIQLYTFPAGKIVIRGSSVDIKLQAAGGDTANTPVVGLGTTVASGVVSVLSGTAAFQNVMTGAAAADCNGTEDKFASGNVVASTAAPSLFLNFAATWSAADTVTVTGNVVIDWFFLET